jgi:2'-5' RNA ligase
MERGAGGAAPPLLRPAEVVPLPPRLPRLFALGFDDADGDCSRLQQSVSDALEAGRFHRPEKRPFWPHVTLARVKRDRRAEPLRPDPPPLDPFRAPQATLYRSVPMPHGARYEALERLALGSR